MEKGKQKVKTSDNDNEWNKKGGEKQRKSWIKKPHGDFLKLTVDLEALSSSTWLAFKDFVNFSTNDTL